MHCLPAWCGFLTTDQLTLGTELQACQTDSNEVASGYLKARICFFHIYALMPPVNSS